MYPRVRLNDGLGRLPQTLQTCAWLNLTIGQLADCPDGAHNATGGFPKCERRLGEKAPSIECASDLLKPPQLQCQARCAGHEKSLAYTTGSQRLPNAKLSGAHTNAR
jgi:hypothetical protein